MLHLLFGNEHALANRHVRKEVVGKQAVERLGGLGTNVRPLRQFGDLLQKGVVFVVELANVDGTMRSEEEDIVHRVHETTDRVFCHVENENALPHFRVSIPIEEWREENE